MGEVRGKKEQRWGMEGKRRIYRKGKRAQHNSAVPPPLGWPLQTRPWKAKKLDHVCLLNQATYKVGLNF